MYKDNNKKKQEIYIYKLNTYISDKGSGYSRQDLDDVEIICYDRKNMYLKICKNVFYIGTISISTTQVLVDLQRKFEKYVIGNALS